MKDGEFSDLWDKVKHLPWDKLWAKMKEVEDNLNTRPVPKFSNMSKRDREVIPEEVKRAKKHILSESSEAIPAFPNKSPPSKITGNVTCEATTAVESITPDKSDSESKMKPPIPDKEATDSHLRVAIVNEHNFLGQVSAKTAAYIKSQLLAALRLAVRDDVFVPTFKTWTHTGDILRITCTDIGALDWLSKAVQRIPETVHTKFQVIQEDRLPKITKISLLIPDAKVEEMNEVKKLLALQNVTVKVSSWCIFHKESKEDGLFIVAGTVDEDVAAIEAQGGSIFYEFSTVKVTIHSPEEACPSNSATETNHTCKKAPDCLSFEQLFQANGPEKENRTHKEIRDRKKKAFQQTNNNM